MAAELRQGVHLETGLTCSAGVAPNRLLAKVLKMKIIYFSSLSCYEMNMRSLHRLFLRRLQDALVFSFKLGASSKLVYLGMPHPN